MSSLLKSILLLVLGAILGAIGTILVLFLLLANALRSYNIAPLDVYRAATGTTTTTSTNPLITDEQASILEAVGIDVNTLPTTMTPELAACLTNALGTERVSAILGGATITITDVLSAKSCLE